MSAISRREQVSFQRNVDEVRFLLDLHAKLEFYSGSSLKQKNKRTVPRSNRKIIVTKTKYIPSTNMLSIKDSSVCMISILGN